MSTRLSSLLVQATVVSVRQIERALERQVLRGGQLDTNLLEIGVSEAALLPYLARARDLEPAARSVWPTPAPALLALIPREVAQRVEVAPLGREGGRLYVLTHGSFDASALAGLSAQLGLAVLPVVIPEFRLHQALERYYQAPMPPRSAALVTKLPADIPSAEDCARDFPWSHPGAHSGAAPPATPPPAPGAASRGESLVAPVLPVGVPFEAPPEPRRRTPPPPVFSAPVPAATLQIPKEAPPAAPEATIQLPKEALLPVEDEPVSADSAAAAEDDATPEEEAGTTEIVEIEPEPDEVPVPTRRALPPLPVPAPPAPAAASAAPATSPANPAPSPGDSAAPRAKAPNGTSPSAAPVPDALAGAGLAAAPSAPAPAQPRNLTPATGTAVVMVPHSPGADASNLPPMHRPAPGERISRRLSFGQSRDEILREALKYAWEFAEFVLLFHVQSDAGVVIGKEAAGQAGGPNPLEGISLSIAQSPLLRRALEAKSFFLGVPSEDPILLDLFGRFGRGAAASMFVVPVVLKNRVVALITGASGRNPFSPAGLIDLVPLGPLVSKALIEFIQRGKTSGGPASPASREASAPANEAPASAAPTAAPGPGGSAGLAAIVAPLSAPAPAGGGEMPAALEDSAEEVADEEAIEIIEDSEPGAENPSLSALHDEHHPKKPSDKPRIPPSPPVPVRLSADLLLQTQRLEQEQETVDILASLIQPKPKKAAYEPIQTREADIRGLVELLDHATHPSGTPASLDELNAASDRLVAFGRPALARLVEHFPGRRLPSLTGSSRYEEGGVLRALLRFGASAVPELQRLAAERDPTRRLYAVWSLASLQSPDALPTLAECILDEEQVIRQLAAGGASRLRTHPNYKIVLSSVRIALQDPQPERRARAAQAALELRAVALLPDLIDVLEDPSLAVAQSVHSALVSISFQDLGNKKGAWVSWWKKHLGEPREAWLIESLSHKAPEVRRAAASELYAMTGQTFGYNPDAEKSERKRSISQWESWLAGRK